MVIFHSYVSLPEGNHQPWATRSSHCYAEAPTPVLWICCIGRSRRAAPLPQPPSALPAPSSATTCLPEKDFFGGRFMGICCWDLLGFVGIYWDVLGLLGWVIIGDTVDYHGYNGFLMGHYIWENDLWMGIQWECLIQYNGAQRTNRDSQTSSFSVCSADPKCYPYWFVLRTGFPDYDHPNKVGLKATPL